MQYTFTGTNEVVCAGLNWLPGETKDITDEATIEELDRSPLHVSGGSSPTGASGTAPLPAAPEAPEADGGNPSEIDHPGT